MNDQTRSVYITIRCDVPSIISIEDFTRECTIVVKYDDLKINLTLEDSEE